MAHDPFAQIAMDVSPQIEGFPHRRNLERMVVVVVITTFAAEAAMALKELMFMGTGGFEICMERSDQ